LKDVDNDMGTIEAIAEKGGKAHADVGIRFDLVVVMSA